MKKIALLEVNRLLPELRDTRRWSGDQLCLLKASTAASDPEHQAEREDKADDGP